MAKALQSNRPGLNHKITPTPKKTQTKLCGLDSEVHLPEDPSQVVTVGQAGLLTGKKVTPFFSFLSLSGSFSFTSSSPKKQKNLSSTQLLLRTPRETPANMGVHSL